MGAVASEFEGQLIGPDRQIFATVAVELQWASDDPYAVTAIFTQGDGLPVPWTFDRGQMRGGLQSLRPVGLGDVQFRRQRPSLGGNLEMRLDSPEGVAVVQLPIVPVINFLRETLAVVPFGSESEVVTAAFDRELKELLG